MSSKASGQVNIAIKAVDNASGVFSGLGSKLKGLAGNFGNLGNIASVASGMIVAQFAQKALAAVTDFVKGSLEAFGSFEQTLTTITAISGKTGEAAEKLYKQLEEAAHTSGLQFAVGANKAAKALESLVKAGLEGEDAVKALNAALAMSRIEQMDTAEASDLLVGVMNQFKYSAQDSGKAVDVLVNASVRGVDTASGFATALSYCGSQAASMGFSLEETTGALVAINNQGIAAEKAGRYLGAMFTDLVKKSDKLGFSVYDASGNMLSLKDIIGKLVVKLESFGTQSERDAYLAEVFGKQSARAALSLLNLADGSESASSVLADLEVSMGKSGTAMSVAGQQLDTYAGAQAKLGAATERLQILFGEALAPVVEAVSGFLSGMLLPALEAVGKVIKPFVDLWFSLSEIWYLIAVGIIQKVLLPAFEDLMAAVQPVIDALAPITSAICGAWDFVVSTVNRDLKAFREDLSKTGEAHVEVAGTVGGAMGEMADSVEGASGEIVDSFSIIDLQAEETAAALEKISSSLRESYNVMLAETATGLSDLAARFSEAFEGGAFTEAARIVQEFADQYGISFDKAEKIIRGFVEEEAKQLQSSRELYQDHMGWLQTQYFDKYTESSHYFVTQIESYGEKYKAALQSDLGEAEDIVGRFAFTWRLSWEDAAAILEEYANREEAAFLRSQEILHSHMQFVEQDYFNRYVTKTKEFNDDIELYSGLYVRFIEKSSLMAQGAIAAFAEKWEISWDQAAGILLNYVDEQEQILQRQREDLKREIEKQHQIMQGHLDYLEQQYFNRYVKTSQEFQTEVELVAELLNRMLGKQLGMSERIVAGFAEKWGLSWQEAADILFDAVDQITTKTEELKEIPITFEEQLLGKAQEDFERFKNCISGKAATLNSDVTGEMKGLAGNITDLISAGLVGEAQKEMQAYVECSAGKVYDMVRKIDSYMVDLTEGHNEKLEEMREYAETLTGAEKDTVLRLIEDMTTEYQDKMQNLADWKEKLLNEMVETSAEKIGEIEENMIAPLKDVALEYENLIPKINENLEKLGEVEFKPKLEFEIPPNLIPRIQEELEKVKLPFGENIVQEIEGRAPLTLNFQGPLVNVEGSADQATAELAAAILQEKLQNVIIESTSSEAGETVKRIRFVEDIA